MRQVVLDTETTGLSPEKGHRVIEIGCIELVERRPTGARFHRYLNPERDIDMGALEVHGISEEFLRDKPRFAEVASELLAFIDGAELVIHNAAFDVSFLDAELERAGAPDRVATRARVVDTLALARERYPGQKNSLDALCRRLGVDNSHRELHGALLDASLLAEVYLAMTAGQSALALALDADEAPGAFARRARAVPAARLRVLRADAREVALHELRLIAIGKASRRDALWTTIAAETAPVA
jgi:DNA polymerase III subunit epsilon